MNIKQLIYNGRGDGGDESKVITGISLDSKGNLKKHMKPRVLVIDILNTPNISEIAFDFFKRFAQEACKGTLATNKDFDMLICQSGGFLRSAADNIIKQNKRALRNKSPELRRLEWEITLESNLPI